MHIKSPRKGFTLIEVVTATALVAIMALVVVPPVVKRIEDGRAQATRAELDRIRTALRTYYKDVGAFPSESAGLKALIVDPGDTGWQGPYLTWGSDDPTTAVNTDQFGRQYSYDLAPLCNPQGAADLIVASNGPNGNNDLLVGSTWTLQKVSSCDDQLVMLVAAGLNREKRIETETELEALAEAARDYYRVNGNFPSQMDQLSGDYIHPGIGRSALIDGWGSDYLLHLDAGPPPVLELWSPGPDQNDDMQSGDDLWWTVSSQAIKAEDLTATGGGGGGGETTAPEDGDYTDYLVATAQAAVDANPKLKLKHKDLKHYLGALGLSAMFEHDDWGSKLQVNGKTRQVFSSGPDKKDKKTEDNVPPGVGP